MDTSDKELMMFESHYFVWIHDADIMNETCRWFPSLLSACSYADACELIGESVTVEVDIQRIENES